MKFAPQGKLTEGDKHVLRSCMRAYCHRGLLARIKGNDSPYFSGYTDGIETGVILALDAAFGEWSRGLPDILERYVRRYGCAALGDAHGRLTSG
jgi:hypothetical protein